MTDEIPKLTAAQLARAIPASVRRRLMAGDIRSGDDVAAVRRRRQGRQPASLDRPHAQLDPGRRRGPQPHPRPLANDAPRIRRGVSAVSDNFFDAGGVVVALFSLRRSGDARGSRSVK